MYSTLHMYETILDPIDHKFGHYCNTFNFYFEGCKTYPAKFRVFKTIKLYKVVRLFHVR